MKLVQLDRMHVLYKISNIMNSDKDRMSRIAHVMITH